MPRRDLYNHTFAFVGTIICVTIHNVWLSSCFTSPVPAPDLRTTSVRRTNVRLTKIVQEENTENIDELVELVQENQRLLHKMKENLRKVVLQEVVRIVIKSDLDRDNIISKKEADFLVQRLSYSLEIYGIDFDVDKFHKGKKRSQISSKT